MNHAASIRPGLKSLLLATAFISGCLLLLQPTRDGSHDQIDPMPAALGTAQRSPGPASTRKPLPNALRPAAFEPAIADPFSTQQVLTPSAAAPPSTPPPAPPLQAAAPQAVPHHTLPPTMPYRFFGQLVSPTGEVLVFLAKEGQVVQAQVGAAFGDGYAVTSMDTGSVRLRYTPLGLVHTIPVPTPHGPDTLSLR